MMINGIKMLQRLPCFVVFFFVAFVCIVPEVFADADEYIAKYRKVRSTMGHLFNNAKGSQLPGGGVVVDEATAISVANIIGRKILGSATIEKIQPLWGFYRESDEVWEIRGVVGGGDPDIRGGNILIEISKTDGRILRIGKTK